MRLALLVPLLLVTAGCVGPADERPEPPQAGTREALAAPWWDLGESWTIEFERAGEPTRTTTLVHFANDTFGDPSHFWLGVRDRDEALRHVFFDENPFLGRIHWEVLAPHEKGMHSAMYAWPLEDGSRWTSPLLFGKRDVAVEAERQEDGTFLITGEARADGAKVEYDYVPSHRWFGHLVITEPSGEVALRATVTDHAASGATGTYHFLRGRDYLDASGGRTGQDAAFRVAEEGATSIGFLLDVQTSKPAALEFVAPGGEVWHRETIPLGGARGNLVEVDKPPPPGEWTLRYVGDIQGTVKVRGIIEYKATL